jgi:predicted DNA-binding transcriptional regulator AlpA
MSREPSWHDATSAGIAVPETEGGWQARWANDALVSIADIRKRFKLGRTAAYELTHRLGFPDPVRISPRCYRWWASEVDTFAASLRRERVSQSAAGAPRKEKPQAPDPAVPMRISGTLRAARTRRKAS